MKYDTDLGQLQADFNEAQSSYITEMARVRENDQFDRYRWKECGAALTGSVCSKVPPSSAEGAAGSSDGITLESMMSPQSCASRARCGLWCWGM